MTLTRTIRRTWPERLFSWPWCPWQHSKQVPDPAMERVRQSWAATPIDRVLDPGRPARVERQARLNAVPPLRNPGPVASSGDAANSMLWATSMLGSTDESPAPVLRGPFTSGGGGDFGGGGASGSWDSSPTDSPTSSDSGSTSSGSGS